MCARNPTLVERGVNMTADRGLSGGVRHDPQKVMGKNINVSISLETRSSKHLKRKLAVAVKMELLRLCFLF